MLSQERALFRKVAEAVLEDGLDYRPDPKARSSGELLSHLIGHNLDVVELIDDGIIHHRNQVPITLAQDAAKQLDDSFGLVLESWDRSTTTGGRQRASFASATRSSWKRRVSSSHG